MYSNLACNDQIEAILAIIVQNINRFHVMFGTHVWYEINMKLFCKHIMNNKHYYLT